MGGVINMGMFPKYPLDSLGIIQLMTEFDTINGTHLAECIWEDRDPRGAYAYILHSGVRKEVQYYGLTLLYLYLYSGQTDPIERAYDEYGCRALGVIEKWSPMDYWEQIPRFMRSIGRTVARLISPRHSQDQILDDIIEYLRAWSTLEHETLPEWIGLIPKDSPLATMLKSTLRSGRSQEQ